MASYQDVSKLLNEQGLSNLYKFKVSFHQSSNIKAPLLGTNPPFNEDVFLVQSSTLPVKTAEPIKQKITGGFQVNQPGLTQITQEITLTVLELNNYPVHQFIEQVFQQRTHSGNVKKDEKDTSRFTTKLERLNNSGVVGITYLLERCFLQTYTLPNADGNSNDPEFITLTIGFQNFTFGTDPQKLK